VQLRGLARGGGEAYGDGVRQVVPQIDGVPEKDVTRGVGARGAVGERDGEVLGAAVVLDARVSRAAVLHAGRPVGGGGGDDSPEIDADVVAAGVPIVLVGIELDGDERAGAGRGGIEEAEESPRGGFGEGGGERGEEEGEPVARGGGRVGGGDGEGEGGDEGGRAAGDGVGERDGAGVEGAAGAAGDGAEALVAGEADRLVVEGVPLEGNPRRRRVRGRGEVVREGKWRRGLQQQQQEDEDRQGGGDSGAAGGDPHREGARERGQFSRGR